MSRGGASPDLAAHLEWRVETTSPAVRRWLGESRLRAALHSELQQTWSLRAESAKHLERYARSCPFAGALPDDYRLREIELFPGVVVLAGIHFYNLLTERPFVDVEAQSCGLTPAQIAVASLRLQGEFAMFRPLDVRWWSAAPGALAALPAAREDQRFLVGHLAEIAARASAALPAGFSLDPDPELATYAEYARIHGDFIRAHPEWKNGVMLEDRASLRACAQAGGLYCLREGARVAGVIAACPEVQRGVWAWYIREQILDTAYRGRGLAVRVQRAFLAALDRSRAELVSGYIDALNLPSLGTALRCGRLQAGGWVFVPV